MTRKHRYGLPVSDDNGIMPIHYLMGMRGVMGDEYVTFNGGIELTVDLEGKQYCGKEGEGGIDGKEVKQYFSY